MDLQAIFDNWRSTVTNHYFDMNGRVGRSQFWYFVAANIVIAVCPLRRLIAFNNWHR